MGWQDHPQAPAPGALLCRLQAIPDGGCKELRYGSGDAAFSLLLYRQGEQVRAYVNSCPHFSVPLNAHPDEFLVLEQRRVMCAWHCSVFELDDGRCVDGPAQGMGLQPVPVRLEQDRVIMAAAQAGAAGQ
jgi:nitrite reductase/ring-hydroxylating ferredoxin subunit